MTNRCGFKRIASWPGALAMLAAVILATACPGSLRAAERRPNIVFIYTDDQGAWTTGYSGNRQAHTPHLDRLRAAGADFTHAYVTTPVCSPSRATLMTGRYASELGIDDWIHPSSKQGLSRKLPVWPKLLKDAGYATGLIGKWHVGHTAEHHPTKYGYGHFMGLLRGGCPTANPTLEKDGKDRKFNGLTVDILTDHALAFIEKNQAKPFALSLHYRAPHAAFLPVSKEDWSHHKDYEPAIPSYPDIHEQRIKKDMREYLASVTSIDRNLGRLMDKLDALKLTDNTVVIFTSDHGYNMGHHGVWSKGNAVWRLKTKPKQAWPNVQANRRPNLWDTSLRVPLVIRWPGVVKPNSTIRQTVDNTDWFPTLCAIAGVKLPRDVQAGLRGADFSPLLRGKELLGWDNTLYAEYNMRSGATTAMRCWRTPSVKLMVDFNNRDKQGRLRAELYDLSGDPGESKNLLSYPADGKTIASQGPFAKDEIAFLYGELVKHMKQIGDPVAKKAPAALGLE